MYERFREYEGFPHSKRAIKKNYTDTADTGSDYLCSICYIETEIGIYVTDVLYSQKPMEYTEPKTAEMLSKNKTSTAVIESNNGGRSFARAVEKQCRLMGNHFTQFNWFFQGENKAVRIFTHSAEVQNIIYFPRGWETMWPQFYIDVTGYLKAGKNAHDDGPDCLTGMVERYDKNNISNLSVLTGWY
jgi:predicted phage terminase large subunit-like protein